MRCPGGNATDPIWRVLASSDGISSWTPLKPQHSNPNPKPLANQLWCIDFLTPLTPLIIPHRLPAFLESLMPLKNSCSIHARCSKNSLKHSMRFCGIFPSLKQNFIAYCSSKVSSCPDCIFEIYQLWQSGFSRVYSNCCCSCSFEAEIIKTGQSSHKMYSNNIVNFQESTTILNACTQKVWKLIECTTYFLLRFTHVFYWCCSAWIPLQTKFDNSRYDVIIWTFQPMNFSIHVRIIGYDMIKEDQKAGWLVVFCFCFTVYQPFWCHLTPNWISNNSV